MGETFQPMDGRRAWEICDGDAELYASLVLVYIETWDEVRQAILIAVDSGTAANLEDALHRLKGALRNLAVTAVTDRLQLAEDSARQGDKATAVQLWNKTLPLVEEGNAFLARGEWRKVFSPKLS